MKKRLVFYVINDLTYDQRMIRICSSLVKEGFSVTLIGRQLPDSIPLENQPYRQVRMRCVFRKGPFFYLEYNLRILFHLLFNSFDACCACDLDTALPVHFAGKWKRITRILDAHEYFTEVPEVMARPLVRRIWQWIGRITIPHFQLRYTVNHPLSVQLEKRYGAAFEVIRNLPILTEEQARHEKISNPGQERNQPIILYQGALNAGRGLEQMIAALPQVNQAVLWLVGEGDLSRPLRDLVDRMGLGPRVKFAGRKTPAELSRMTREATVGLNLLVPESLNYYYSLANKFFDYMHAGVPSVNMCFPAYQEILESHPVGICLDSLNPGELAASINGLLTDQEELGKMRSAAHSASRIFNWGNESGKLARLYQGLFSSEAE